MLSFHSHLKIFLATGPCDPRMNFNGLWSAAQADGAPRDLLKTAGSENPDSRHDRIPARKRVAVP
jgi:hypothetical protein